MEFFGTDVKKLLDNIKDIDDEGLVESEPVDEDLDASVVDVGPMYKELFNDGKYSISQPTCADGFAYLAQGTNWLSTPPEYGDGIDTHARRLSRVDQIDDDSYYLSDDVDYNRYYILQELTGKGRKFLVVKGYGSIRTPTGTWTSGSRYIADTGDAKLSKFFIDNRFPYITNSLQGREGDKLGQSIQDRETLTYPDDFTGQVSAKDIPYGVRTKMKATKIIVREGTTAIEHGAFQYMHNLKEVVLPEGLLTIGNNAFSGCSLKEIRLPSTLRRLGIESFKCCPLTSIALPASLESIGKGCFEGSYTYDYSSDVWTRMSNGTLTEVTIPSKVKTIGDNAFQNQPLRSVSLPSGLKSIGHYAFCNTQLESVDLPDGLQKIGSGCFSDTKISDLFIPTSVQTVGRGILRTDDNRNVEKHFDADKNFDPASGTTIRCGADSKPAGWEDEFAVCYYRRVRTTVPNRWGYYDWQTDTYPCKVIWGASRNGSVHEDLTPEYSNITPKPIFSDEAFDVYNPQNTDELAWLAQDTEWSIAAPDFDFTNKDGGFYTGEGDGSRVCRKFYIFVDKRHSYHKFIYCPSMRFSLPSRTNSTWGFLYDKDGYSYSSGRWAAKGTESLIQFLREQNAPGLTAWAMRQWRQGLQSYKNELEADEVLKGIDYTVEYLSEFFNTYCDPEKDAEWKSVDWYIRQGIKHLIIPEGVKRIPPRAFMAVRKIETVTFPSTLEVIDGFAFYGHPFLTKITLPDNLRVVRAYAFGGCGGIRAMFIPKSVVEIEDFMLSRTNYSAIIYCESESLPFDWHTYWNYRDQHEPLQVKWGVTKEKFDEAEYDPVVSA